MNSDRKKINKIYSQIDKIALGGKDNYIEYCKFIDDSIVKSDYDNLLQCLYYNYSIDIEKFLPISFLSLSKSISNLQTSGFLIYMLKYD